MRNVQNLPKVDKPANNESLFAKVDYDGVYLKMDEPGDSYTIGNTTCSIPKNAPKGLIEARINKDKQELEHSNVSEGAIVKNPEYNIYTAPNAGSHVELDFLPGTVFTVRNGASVNTPNMILDAKNDGDAAAVFLYNKGNRQYTTTRGNGNIITPVVKQSGNVHTFIDNGNEKSIEFCEGNGKYTGPGGNYNASVKTTIKNGKGIVIYPNSVGVPYKPDGVTGTVNKDGKPFLNCQ